VKTKNIIAEFNIVFAGKSETEFQFLTAGSIKTVCKFLPFLDPKNKLPKPQ